MLWKRSYKPELIPKCFGNAQTNQSRSPDAFRVLFGCTCLGEDELQDEGPPGDDAGAAGEEIPEIKAHEVKSKHTRSN